MKIASDIRPCVVTTLAHTSLRRAMTVQPRLDVSQGWSRAASASTCLGSISCRRSCCRSAQAVVTPPVNAINSCLTPTLSVCRLPPWVFLAALPCFGCGSLGQSATPDSDVLIRLCCRRFRFCSGSSSVRMCLLDSLRLLGSLAVCSFYYHSIAVRNKCQMCVFCPDEHVTARGQRSKSLS